MKDRIPLYPGRVKLNPVSGQPNTFDLVRADQPTQEGTPLNKASLLKDTTAALFGLGADAVPDDVLHLLSRFQSGLGNEYVWAKISEQIQNEYDEGTTTGLISFSAISGRTVTFVYGDTYSVNDDGIHTTINQPDEITVNVNSPASIFDGMKGKWWSYKDYGNTNQTVYYLPTSATITRDTSAGYPNYKSNESMTVRSSFHNVTTKKIIGYVNSPSPDAYPPAVDDGYTYTPLGQLGDKVRIAMGSYTGTGTYGADNPNSLTFEFEPVYILIFFVGHGMASSQAFFIKNAEKVGVAGQTVFYSIGTTTTWYCPNIGGQMNSAGSTYVYFAIG